MGRKIHEAIHALETVRVNISYVSNQSPAPARLSQLHPPSLFAVGEEALPYFVYM